MCSSDLFPSHDTIDLLNDSLKISLESFKDILASTPIFPTTAIFAKDIAIPPRFTSFALFKSFALFASITVFHKANSFSKSTFG